MIWFSAAEKKQRVVGEGGREYNSKPSEEMTGSIRKDNESGGGKERYHRPCLLHKEHWQKPSLLWVSQADVKGIK